MAKYNSIDSLIIKLEKLEDIDLTQALHKACLVVENTAKEKCPVETGSLRSSITHEVQCNTGVIGTNVEYAPYVEFGTGLYSILGNGRQTQWKYKTADGKWHTTSGQKAQPYLTPALYENKDMIEQIISESVKEALK